MGSAPSRRPPPPGRCPAAGSSRTAARPTLPVEGAAAARIGRARGGGSPLRRRRQADLEVSTGRDLGERAGPCRRRGGPAGEAASARTRSPRARTCSSSRVRSPIDRGGGALLEHEIGHVSAPGAADAWCSATTTTQLGGGRRVRRRGRGREAGGQGPWRSWRRVPRRPRRRKRARGGGHPGPGQDERGSTRRATASSRRARLERELLLLSTRSWTTSSRRGRRGGVHRHVPVRLEATRRRSSEARPVAGLVAGDHPTGVPGDLGRSWSSSQPRPRDRRGDAAGGGEAGLGQPQCLGRPGAAVRGPGRAYGSSSPRRSRSRSSSWAPAA